MEEVVVPKVEKVDGAQASGRTVYLGQGDGAVEGDDGGGDLNEQLVVELQDLGPVRLRRSGGAGVHGIDRGLDLIRPWLVATKAGGDHRVAAGDLVPVPEGSVLLGQKDK